MTTAQRSTYGSTQPIKAYAIHHVCAFYYSLRLRVAGLVFHKPFIGFIFVFVVVVLVQFSYIVRLTVLCAYDSIRPTICSVCCFFSLICGPVCFVHFIFDPITHHHHCQKRKKTETFMPKKKIVFRLTFSFTHREVFKRKKMKKMKKKKWKKTNIARFGLRST